MRAVRFVLVGIGAAAGCQSEKPAEQRSEGALPIRFGDCASTTTTWVSGPRPLPFTREQADAATAGVKNGAARASGGAFTSVTTVDSTGADDTDIYGGLLGTPDAGFGLGMRGVGVGGGGGIDSRPADAIDPSRYATVTPLESAVPAGDVGSGRGMSRKNGRTYPSTQIGELVVKGPLDKVILRRYFKRNLQKITFCYEKQLAMNPKLGEGTTSVTLFIAPSGNVATASATGFDPTVARCVVDVTRSIEFPKPQKDGGVQVTLPLTFKPGDGPTITFGAETPPPVAGDTSALRAPLFRARSPGDEDAGYVPGKDNPLRAEQPAIVDCLRRAAPTSLHYGAAVFELGVDGTQAVRVAGIDDAKVEACLVAAARRTVHAATGLRCSLAFGDMPSSALPALDIGTDSVVLEDKAIAAGTLRDAITKRIDAATKERGGVSLHGPLIARVADGVPMRTVLGIVYSVLEPGDDIVFAAQSSREWETLEPLSLPIVPVPLGTGGVWNHVSRPATTGGTAANRPAILVAIRKTELAVARTDEQAGPPLPCDGSQQQKLAATLATYRRTAPFDTRTDLRLAVDDDVSYADFAATVRTVLAAGFARWELVPMRSL